MSLQDPCCDDQRLHGRSSRSLNLQGWRLEHILCPRIISHVRSIPDDHMRDATSNTRLVVEFSSCSMIWLRIRSAFKTAVLLSIFNPCKEGEVIHRVKTVCTVLRQMQSITEYLYLTLSRHHYTDCQADCLPAVLETACAVKKFAICNSPSGTLFIYTLSLWEKFT